MTVSLENKDSEQLSRGVLNPIQDGLFRGCLRMEGAKRPPSLKSVTHILQ